MRHLDAILAARAFRDGTAKRNALFRHRHLIDDPIAIVLWQLGAEPFSAAAVGYGRSRRNLNLLVAGDPINRDLAFAALVEFAHWFNPQFEMPASDREEFRNANRSFTRSRNAPQIVVANGSSVEMLGRLGRRLAYLRTDGPQPAPAELVRLGQHLLFIARHARMPGQQLVVSLTDLVGSNWATGQSPEERLSLAALNAYIEPPNGHGFYAAMDAELYSVGPVPDGDDDVNLAPLVEEFNQRRAGRVDPAIVRPLLAKISDHYNPLVKRTWDLVWDCRDREASWPEAPSVPRRWDLDRDAYTQHLDWTMQLGRRRTRQTPRQAAMLLRQLEDAKATLDAEEACDDPVRMIRYLLEGKAVEGRVVRIDLDHQEMGAARRVRRPLVTIACPDACLMPTGKELWWTGCSGGRSYEVIEIRPASKGGSTVILKLSTGTKGVPMPRAGDNACFSIHTTRRPWLLNLPPTEPWTHRPDAKAPDLPILEETEA